MPRHSVGIFSARREISRRRHPGSSDTRDPLPLLLPLAAFSRTIPLENQARRREVVAEVPLFNREHQRCEPSFHSSSRGRERAAIHAVSRRTPFLSLPLGRRGSLLQRQWYRRKREERLGPLYNSRRGCLYRGKINIINNMVKERKKERKEKKMYSPPASRATTLPQNVSLAAW